MPKVLPPDFLAEEITNRAERRVFDALVSGLDNTYHLIHSKHIKSPEGMDQEIDMVLLHKKGLMLIEVKGGQVQLNNGRWLRGGQPISPNPITQVRNCVHTLVAQLKKVAPNSASQLRFGSCIALPETCLVSAVSPQLNGIEVLDEASLDCLAERVDAIYKRLPYPNKQLRDNQLEELLSLLAPTIRVAHFAKSRASRITQRSVALTKNQVMSHTRILSEKMILVKGPAGTGKSVLAVEAALHFARLGRDVLYVCHSHLFKDWIKSQLREEFTANVVIATELTSVAAKPSLVIIADEAQDYAEHEWHQLIDLPYEKLFLFCDPYQSTLEVQNRYEDWFGKAQSLQLEVNCRNPREIAELSGKFTEERVQVPVWINDEDIKPELFLELPDSHRVLSMILDECETDGFHQNDIVVIFPDSAESTVGPLLSNRIHPRWRFTDSLDSWRNGKGILATAINRFKGLESEVVIMLGLAEDVNLQRYCYIGITRCLARLVILCSDQSAYDGLKESWAEWREWTDIKLEVDEPLLKIGTVVDSYSVSSNAGFRKHNIGRIRTTTVIGLVKELGTKNTAEVITLLDLAGVDTKAEGFGLMTRIDKSIVARLHQMRRKI